MTMKEFIAVRRNFPRGHSKDQRESFILQNIFIHGYERGTNSSLITLIRM
jgi:hypothetical protein